MIELPDDVRNRLRLNLEVARHCGNLIADIDTDDLALILGESGRVCPPKSTLAAALLANLDEAVLVDLVESLERSLDGS